MNALIDAAIHHRRTALLTLVLLLIAGTYAYITIPKESSPDINIPFIYVSMVHEGISPSDAERLLIRPMEQELQSIEGIKEMTATGYLGGANVLLEFTAGFDADKALADVREKVDRVKPDLPEETEEPVVSEVNFSLFPVLVVTLSADMPERMLLKIARDLQDAVEALPMVLEANIAGDREEQVEVVIDPVLIASYQLEANQLLSYFSRSDKLVAAGNLDTGKGRFAVKVPGLFESVHDIANMPLRVNGDSVIQVKDVAEVRRTFKDPDSFARLNGQKALAIEVVKRTGENVIETIESVRRVVEEESRFWPAGIDISYTRDSSTQIKTMLTDLQNNVISAILLVMIVCVGALGLVAGGLVGVAIPGAFLTGVLIVYMMGLTVNVVVLFALILSVGMLVDGAIVVTELADRKMAEGLPRLQAYALAAKRMSWPIISSTATTLAAFFPLLFWPGVVGEFMKFLPITLIAVLVASLMMALVFVPVLGSVIGRPGAVDPETMRMLSAAEGGNLGDIRGFTGFYLKILKGALRFPLAVLFCAVAALIGVQWYYASHGHGVEFFPDIEPENGIVMIHARGNLSVFEQDQLVREVEKRVLDTRGIRAAYTRVGTIQGGGGMGGGEMSEDVIGTIQLEFEDWQARPGAEDIFDDIRSRTKDIPGIRVTTQEEEHGPPTGTAIQIRLSSRNPEVLPAAVKTVRDGLESLGGFIDIEDSRPLPGIEWELTVDRAQAAKFGVDVTSVGQSVRTVTNGLKVGEYRPNDAEDEIDIVARYPLDNRSISQLDNIRLETPGGSVPITNFVQRVARPKVSRIERAEGLPQMTVKADVPPDVNVDARVKEVKEWIKTAGIDPSVKIEFKGEDEEQKEAQAFLGKAFVVALFIMAIILVTQFNSFYSAFLILSAVIMSTVGVMLGLIITGKPFGIVMSGIGVIALAGVVVNNNIVLIDTFDNLMAQGKFSLKEAILRTGAQRLRPVFLTAVTTILGLVPMVFQLNVDFFTRDITHGAPSTQWWVDLATAVAFGLFFATPLTLIVTPCALAAKGSVARFFSRFRVKKASAGV